MKRMALACVLISTALLSGCIIVPARGGGHHHGHRYDGGYQGQVYGPAYGQPGRR